MGFDNSVSNLAPCWKFLDRRDRNLYDMSKGAVN